MISGIIAVVLETGLCESRDQPVCVERGDGNLNIDALQGDGRVYSTPRLGRAARAGPA